MLPGSSRIIAIAVALFAVGSTLQAADWTMWGGTPERNMANSVEKGIPQEWDIETGENVKWTAQLGAQTYGNPVIADGKVLVGTNNQAERRPGQVGDKGVVMCFAEADGTFLWQMTHDKLPAGRVNDWPKQGVCSSPAVDGDRFYYVSNRCELICADLNGFRDGENDGPYQDETLDTEIDGDIVWRLDMMAELDVFPHNLATSSPVIDEKYIYLCTGNGVDEGHKEIPMPNAPSFIAVEKATGKVVWERMDPYKNILHGQWSSPALGEIDGVRQAVFPGGDGRVYAYDPETGTPLWAFQCNPADSVWRLGGFGTRNNLIATPVIHDDKVFIAVGQDPEHGEGPGHLFAIDAAKRGEISETGALWHNQDVQRSMSTVAIADGILYTCDLTGFLRAIDVESGKSLWTHDMLAAVWSSPYVVDGKVMLGDEDGDLVVLATGTEKKLLFETNMGNSVYTTPVAANGVLYVTNRMKLFAIAAGAQSDTSEVN